VNRILLAVALVVGYQYWQQPAVPATGGIPAIREVAGTLSTYDRFALKRAYTAMSNIVATDEGLDTTQKLRQFHGTGLRYAWTGVLGHKPGTNPQLGEAIDTAMADALGLGDSAVDAEYRNKAAKFLLEVADSL
jgi:hypothetical protein